MTDGTLDIVGEREILFVKSPEDLLAPGMAKSAPVDPDMPSELLLMLKVWEGLVIGQEGRLPTIEQFDPLNHPELVPHLFHLSGGPNPDDLIAKFCGSRICKLVERDITGLRIGDIYDAAYWGRLREIFGDVLKLPSAIGFASSLHLPERTHIQTLLAVVPFGNSDDESATDILGIMVSPPSN